MQESNESLAGRVVSLQEEVDSLKASAAARYAAWDESMCTERAQQRKANEEVRVAMQEMVAEAVRDRDQTRSQLLVLSKQHQLVLADKAKQYEALQDSMNTSVKDLQHALCTIVEDGCSTAQEISHTLGTMSGILTKV
jgi:hypothetical protein